MKKLVLAVIILIYVTNNAYSQNVCVNYESINSVKDNDSLEISIIKELFLKIYNEKVSAGDFYGKLDDNIDINKLINEDSVQFNVVYSFIVKVTENGKNITIDFEKDTTHPFERIFLIYKNIALVYIKFSVRNEYLIFNHKDYRFYDFYQCLSKQHRMLYCSNSYQYYTFESGYLVNSFDRCLNNIESVSIINYILKNYKDFDPNYENGGFDMGPWDFR